MMTSLARDTTGLQKLSALPSEPALLQAVDFLAGLVKDPAFLESQILPLLKQPQTDRWYVAHRHDGQDESCSLQVFVWPPGSATRIHDHTSWGAFCTVAGYVLEERYERLDDGSRSGFARLRKVWQLPWSMEEGVSTVLPYDGGIHRVENLGAGTAVSVHLYGPQTGQIDGRDYDPSCDYVCDRREG